MSLKTLKTHWVLIRLYTHLVLQLLVGFQLDD